MIARVDVVTNTAGFAALQREWAALAAAFPTPLHSFEWFDACRIANDRPCDFAVLVARSGGEVRAIAPLMVDRSGRFPVLRPLDDFTYEVNGFLFADADALAAVAARAQRMQLPLTLRRLRADGPELRALRAAKPATAVAAVRPVSALGSVPTRDGWAALEAGMSSSSRTFMRRKRKIAERDGPVTFEAASPDEASLGRYLEEFFRVEAAGWKGAAGTSLLADLRMQRFVSTLARSAARQGLLRMFFLRIGEATAAARLTVECGKRLWEVKIGYDQRFAQCSPGILLMHETLRYACDRGLDGYEFLGASETWHRHWPGRTEACASFRAYPLTISGLALLGEDAGRVVGRRAREAMARHFRRGLPAGPGEQGATGTGDVPSS